MAIWYQYETAYFSAPYADNRTAVKSRLTPLILRASNTTTMFRSRVVKLVQFYPKITPETISVGRPEIQNFAMGGACPQTSLRTLLSHTGTSLLKFLDPPLLSSCYLYILNLNSIVCTDTGL